MIIYICLLSGGNGREEDLVTIVTNDQTEEKTEESVRRKNVED